MVNSLFKRIFLTLVTLNLLFFGSITTLAQTTTLASVEQEQNTDSKVEQNQSVDSGGTAKTIEQGQGTLTDRDQEQSIPEQVNEDCEQSELAADEPIDCDSDTTERDSETTPETETNTEKTVNEDESLEESIEKDVNEEEEDSYTQKQTVKIIAGQEQTVTDAEQLVAGQEQDVTLNLGQSQKVTQGDEQYQDTAIITEQDQSFVNKGQTDEVTQTQLTNIISTQEGEINLEDGINVTKQESDITLVQNTEAKTGVPENDSTEEAPSTIIEQGQSVTVKASKNDTNYEEIQEFTAGTSSVVKIFKKLTQTFVSIFQSISIDGYGTKEINETFELKEDGFDKKQTYTKNYSWGTLEVANQVSVGKTEDNNILSNLMSFIKLNFFLPKNPEPVDEDSDGDGLTDDEERTLGTDPFKSDTDGDGITDYYEVRKFQTNPLKVDSDGDGLTDYFEVIYHSSSSYSYSIETMTYAPSDLNPLNPDTDGDGIRDNKEDFDEDSFTNAQEQSNGTNPYKKD